MFFKVLKNSIKFINKSIFCNISEIFTRRVLNGKLGTIKGTLRALAHSGTRRARGHLGTGNAPGHSSIEGTCAVAHSKGT